MDKLNYLNQPDNSVIDGLYEQYKLDPDSVDESWKKFFEGFDFARINFKDHTVLEMEHELELYYPGGKKCEK